MSPSGVKKLFAAILIVAATRSAVSAGASLAHVVPADSELYLRVVLPDAPQEEVQARITALRDALAQPSFLDGWGRYLLQRAGGEELKLRKKEIQLFRGVFAQTDWWPLISREFVVAARFNGRHREWLAAFDVGSENRDKILSSLREALFAAATRIPAAELDAALRRDVELTCLYSLINPAIEFCATGAGDFVFLSTSRHYLRAALQLERQRARSLPFALARPDDLSLKNLAPKSQFAASFLSGAPQGRRAGFEFAARPSPLFVDLTSDDVLLSGWKSVEAVGDFHGDGHVSFTVRTEFSGSSDELARTVREAILDPVKDGTLVPILYRELGALIPAPDRGQEPAGVVLLARDLAEWLRAGVDALQPMKFELDLNRPENGRYSAFLVGAGTLEFSAAR